MTPQLANIKTTLRGIAAAIAGTKRGTDSLQAMVQQFGSQITETKSRISMLEDGYNTREKTLTHYLKTVAQLQERVTYLEDAGGRDDGHMVCVLENPEKGDMKVFVCTLLKTEFKQVQGCRPKPNSETRYGPHILVKFLRFGTSEAVLRATQEKRSGKWQGQYILHSTNLKEQY